MTVFIDYRNASYQGTLDNGARQSLGILITDSAQFLLGEWKNDKIEGRYVYISPKQRVFGEIRKGNPYGFTAVETESYNKYTYFTEGGAIKDFEIREQNNEFWVFDCFSGNQTLQMHIPRQQQPNKQQLLKKYFGNQLTTVQQAISLLVQEAQRNAKNRYSKIQLTRSRDMMKSSREYCVGYTNKKGELNGLGIVIKNNRIFTLGSFRDGQLEGIARKYPDIQTVEDGVFKMGQLYGAGVKHNRARDTFFAGVFANHQKAGSITQGAGYPADMIYSLRRIEHLKSVNFVNKHISCESILNINRTVNGSKSVHDDSIVVRNNGKNLRLDFLQSEVNSNNQGMTPQRLIKSRKNVSTATPSSGMLTPSTKQRNQQDNSYNSFSFLTPNSKNPQVSKQLFFETAKKPQHQITSLVATQQPRVKVTDLKQKRIMHHLVNTVPKQMARLDERIINSEKTNTVLSHKQAQHKKQHQMIEQILANQEAVTQNVIAEQNKQQIVLQSYNNRIDGYGADIEALKNQSQKQEYKLSKLEEILNKQQRKLNSVESRQVDIVRVTDSLHRGYETQRQYIQANHQKLQAIIQDSITVNHEFSNHKNKLKMIQNNQGALTERLQTVSGRQLKHDKTLKQFEEAQKHTTNRMKYIQDYLSQQETKYWDLSSAKEEMMDELMGNFETYNTVPAIKKQTLVKLHKRLLYSIQQASMRKSAESGPEQQKARQKLNEELQKIVDLFFRDKQPQLNKVCIDYLNGLGQLVMQIRTDKFQKAWFGTKKYQVVIPDLRLTASWNSANASTSQQIDIAGPNLSVSVRELKSS